MTSVTHCAGADGHETLVAEIWPWVDASVYSFIPLVVIVSLNSLIVRHVISARRMRTQLSSFRPSSSTPGSQQQRAPDSAGHWSLGVLSVHQRAQSRVHRTGRCEQAQDARMIALLLTISFTFLAATLPRCATLIAIAFIKRSLTATESTADHISIYCSVQLALAATNLLMYANHAVNFFLYCAAGEKFRRQLCAVVCWAVRQPRAMTSSPFEVGYNQGP